MEKFWVTSRNDAPHRFDILVWTLIQNCELKFTLRGHEDYVNSVCFSPDGLQLASGSQDATVRIWCLQTGQILRTLIHESEVYDVEFNMEGDRLVSSSKLSLSLWSVGEEPQLVKVIPHGDCLCCASFNPLNGNELFASAIVNKGQVGVWNINEGKYGASKPVPRDVVCMAVSPVGSKVACVFDNGTGIIFDFQLDTAVDINTTEDGSDICFDCTGERFACCGGHSVTIFDSNTAEKLFVIDCNQAFEHPGEGNTVMNICWDASSNHIVATMWAHWAIFDVDSRNMLEVHDGDFTYCRVRTVLHHVVLM